MDDWCFRWLCNEVPTPERLCDVGHFYNLEVASTGEDVKYTPGQPIKLNEIAIERGGISLEVPSKTVIDIANTGIYEVLYVVLDQNARGAYIQLKLNDTLLPQTIYGDVEDKTKYGQALIQVTQPDSKLSLIAVTDVFLNKNALNKIKAINVSLIIQRVCNIV
jgi:hypothetical protein